MRLTLKTLLFASIIVPLLGACTTTTVPAGVNPDRIFDQVYMEGSRDAVEVLKDGLRTRKAYGVTDPYIPLRTPDEVIPVWVPAQVDSHKRRVDAHWEHTVVRESEWYTD